MNNGRSANCRLPLPLLTLRRRIVQFLAVFSLFNTAYDMF
jgi:hypothetical protein